MSRHCRNWSYVEFVDSVGSHVASIRPHQVFLCRVNGSGREELFATNNQFQTENAFFANSYAWRTRGQAHNGLWLASSLQKLVVVARFPRSALACTFLWPNPGKTSRRLAKLGDVYARQFSVFTELLPRKSFLSHFSPRRLLFPRLHFFLVSSSRLLTSAPPSYTKVVQLRAASMTRTYPAYNIVHKYQRTLWLIRNDHGNFTET